jgi:aryl carrier-like protein
MSRPRINEHGEVDLRAVELLSRDDLYLWVRERLHGEDWIVPGGAHGSEMPHYLFALLYPKLTRVTREDLQNILIEFLQDLATNPSSEWLGDAGHELIMLTDPVLVQSPRREDAIDLFLKMADSEHLKSVPWPNLHFRSLQGLVMLQHRANIDFWLRQSPSKDTRYSPVALEGLALVDVAAPFSWLREIEWDDAVEDGIVGLLPSLLESYGTAKVAASIENVLPWLSHRGVSTLVSFCEQEGITISLPNRSGKENAYDVIAQAPLPPIQGNVIPPLSVEQQLSNIWAEVLGVEKVGVHDNFFDLGGDSILSIQVVARANQVGLQLALRQLFEHPTIAELASVVAKPTTVFSPAYFPVSYSQQRLWIQDQLVPGSPFYNIPSALRLNGPLNVPVLERCFNEIIRRHEALRTTFQVIEGRPVQVITPEVSLTFLVFDISSESRVEQEKTLSRVTQEDAQRPFDLSRGPLLRLTLLRFGEDEHVLLIVMHHIISDEWSFSIFIREMVALYNAFAAGEPSPLPELYIQYADFAIWQREWLSSELLEEHLDYWRKQLSGASTVLELPTDRPRPISKTFNNGAEHQVMLHEGLERNLEAFNRQEGVTLFMTLLAAFQVLLYRYTGQDDIIVGVPIANRTQPELEPLIGCFVNALVLRTDMSGNPTFRELLSRVREVSLSAYAHQELPFEKIVKELQPERSLSHMPLFQVMLVLHYVPTPVPELEGLSITPVRVTEGRTQFDLTLIATKRSDGISCVFEYDTDLFDPTTIARMADHFRHLLSALIAQPDSYISSLPLLTSAERQQLPVRWNDMTALQEGDTESPMKTS